MRIAGLIVIILIGISATVQARRPSRSLDQLDLLSVPKATVPPAATPLSVDAKTLEMFAPLIAHCRKLEADYTSGVLSETSRQKRSAQHERFMQRIGAIYRSITLIEKMQPLSAEVQAVADESEETAEDAATMLAILLYGGGETFASKIAELNKKFGITESTDQISDRERLVGAMLRRINQNFNRFSK